MSTNNPKNNKITTALLMAAGMGTRLRPLSEKVPKPLTPVKGIPMIETLIQAIKKAGIEEIYITVGYKKEKYDYLKEKYSNITLIENKEYTYKSTISSVYAAIPYIINKNVLICESDFYVADYSIIKGTIDKSRYFLRNVAPQNYEWGFEIEDDNIRKVLPPAPNVFLDHHLYGMAYWMKEDLNKLIDAINKAYLIEGHEQKSYDEIANEILNQIDMGYIRVNSGQIFEIDSLEDLVKVDASYRIYMDKNYSNDL